jgi:hypothetical protein
MNGAKMIKSGTFDLDYIMDWFNKNSTVLTAVLAGMLVLGGGLYGYCYWNIQKEQAAHTILTDCMAQYDQAVQGKAKWDDVIAMCQAGYEKFSSTKVALYIRAIQVDALLAQQRKSEAEEYLGMMLASMSAHSPLYNLYALKLALLRLDMPHETANKDGLKKLEELATDLQNTNRDAAQYYLGLYYATHDNASRAKEVWQTLAAQNATIADNQARSPWAAHAQEKLNGLS